MSNVTAKQASAAIEMIRIAYEAVASRGTEGMPSGHLYALMMSAFASVDQYQSMVDLMVRTKLLSQNGLILIAAKV